MALTVTCLGVREDLKTGRVYVSWDDGSTDEYAGRVTLSQGLAELETDAFLPTLKRLTLQAALSQSPQKNSFAAAAGKPIVWDLATVLPVGV